jgi:hypothetical protein
MISMADTGEAGGAVVPVLAPPRAAAAPLYPPAPLAPTAGTYVTRAGGPAEPTRGSTVRVVLYGGSSAHCCRDGQDDEFFRRDKAGGAKAGERATQGGSQSLWALLCQELQLRSEQEDKLIRGQAGWVTPCPRLCACGIACRG